MTSTSAAQLDLTDLDACAVSDALDTLGLTGVAYGLSRLSTDTRVRGRAITVRLVEVGQGSPSGRHLGTAAVEASGPGTVVVVDNGGRTRVSGWGGNLSLAASLAGCEGVVIDGACRDIEESAEYGLAVFARNAVPATARGRVVEEAWDVPVSICGVTVNPGDLVVADGSGVVFVPGGRVDEVVALARAVVDAERRMAADIRAGVPVSEVMGAKYERMLDDGGAPT